jgi:phosphoserine phosphatase
MERPAEEITHAVRQACAADPSAVVAFDGDGTLWSGDVGEDFFFHILERVEILEPAERAARALAALHGVASHGTARQTAQAMYDAYRAGTFPEPEICELMAWILAGRSRREAGQIAREVHAPGEMAERLRRPMRVIIEGLRGIETFVVSASPTLVVAPVAASLGWDASHVVALETKFEGDVVLAEAVRPITYAEGKVTNLRTRIGQRPIAAAFGDSAFDVALLASAKIRVAVHPKPALLEQAPDGTVILTGA